MDTSRLGEELLALCKSEDSKFAEIKSLLEVLAEDERREALTHKDVVSLYEAEDPHIDFYVLYIQTACY